MGYFRLPSPVKQLPTTPALPPPGTPGDWQCCTKCLAWRPPAKFESKGQRGGRQVRRKVCDDCRLFKKRIQAWTRRQYVNARRAARRRSEQERTCKYCGRTWAITRFRRCGDKGQYRLWACWLCGNRYANERRKIRAWERQSGELWNFRRIRRWKQIA